MCHPHVNRPVTHFSLLNKQSKPPPEATFSLTASMHGGVRTVGVGKKAYIYLYISLSVRQFRGFDLLMFCKKNQKNIGASVVQFPISLRKPRQMCIL